MHRIKTHFSKTVDDYDTVADHVVFKNDEIHNELIKWIPHNNNKKFKILDLWCGTWHGIKLAAYTFPKAQITGIDFSPIMIKKAKKNLLPFADRINIIETDVNDYKFNDKFDIIISAVTIHNMTHPQKENLFKKIFQSLTNKWIFINADFYEHESTTINNYNNHTYEQFLRQNLSGEELNVRLRHAFEEDMPMTLTQQFNLLKKSGFTQIKLPWVFNNEAVYIAKK